MDLNCSCGKGDDPHLDIKEHTEDCARRKAFDPATFEGIMMSTERAVCGLHALPFKDGWPRGALVFMVTAFSEATAIPGIWDEARRLGRFGPEVETIPVKALERVFDVKPICCRLSRPNLVKAYEATKVGTMARCKFCDRKGIGTPIETEQQGKIKHVCFPCLAGASSTPFHTH